MIGERSARQRAHIPAAPSSAPAHSQPGAPTTDGDRGAEAALFGALHGRRVLSGIADLQRLAGNAAVAGRLAARRPARVQRQAAGAAAGGNADAAPAGPPTLREGDTGEAVRDLQEKLSLATGAGGALVADGRFGPATRRRLVTSGAARE